MANVKQYTDQIDAAKKGKDVRSAIVNAINAVSDENNTYNQTKAAINADKTAVEAAVAKNTKTEQSFAKELAEAKGVQTDLADKISKGNTLASDLGSKTTAGNTLLSNLTKKVTEGSALDTNLGKKNTTAQTLHDNLTKDIETANTAKSTLEGDITAAGQAERSLEADITAAGQAERSLEADITAAGQAKKDLEADISQSRNNIQTMQQLVQNAGQIQTTLETDMSAASKTIESLGDTTDKSVKTLQDTGAEQVRIITENGGGIENALSNYFALRRNGRVFTTKIYKWSTSTSPVGVKMNANEGMVCTPSIGRQKGQDDYEQFGLFHHFTCNFTVDESGFNHVTALEGQAGFSRTGKVQVGEVTMSAWFGIEDQADGVLYHYSDTKTELTPYPMKECINPDNTIGPFMIHAKYTAGDIDGAPYSSKGLAPANGCRATQARQPISYTGMVGYMHKLGSHYCGTTSWDLFYRQLMMIIKYATTNSQNIMAGCTSYNSQRNAVVAEQNVTRVIVTKAQAAEYIVGSYVSVGEMGSATNKDRYYEYMHNLAYSVKVLSIEDVDGGNAAINLDTVEPFNTTTTTCISTMPWHSGSTDEVDGSDGCLGSPTSGKYAYKIQGIETGVGTYEVLGNVVMDIVTGSDGNPARNVYVCDNASLLTTSMEQVKARYKLAIAQVAYTAASWKYTTRMVTDPNLGIMIPVEYGAGTTTGWCDGTYTDTGASGQREWLALGTLNYGGTAGLWFLNAPYGWSGAYWDLASGVSPNGTRGEYQAAA